MSLTRIAAFADGESGGNPAGVFIADHHPSEQEMQSLAAEVGYSETAFAEPAGDSWRVRYFSPENEVPFCGHATIALGAVLAQSRGAGVYKLKLNEADISVEGFSNSNTYSAALQSPDTHSTVADTAMVREALQLFGYRDADLDPGLPPAFAHAGANHLIIGLNSRSALSAMSYSLDAGRQFMLEAGLVTVMLVYVESKQLFHSRNPFASGGVYEDPATGAASAAFAGFLRDIDWPHGGEIDIVQGEDMGARSLIKVELSEIRGSSVRVSGATRSIEVA